MKNTFDSEEFRNRYTYDRQDLGATYTEEKTIFKVWAPTAERVTVNLYTTGSDAQAGAALLEKLEMSKAEKGIWQLEKIGCHKGTYYTYTVCTEGISKETADVYTKACGVNGMRSMIVDLKSTDPMHFRQNDSWLSQRHELAQCPVIYELHIKDFSQDVDSGISDENRGKYLAFTEKNTTLSKEGERPTGLSYLKSMGMTHVHLLPFFDYGSVDEGGNLNTQFNWGYDPVHYQAPEGSYSSDPYHGEVRIKECKQMIHALHEAGIAVVMDVVFNHTYSLDSVFQRTVPDYYYRKGADGTFSNGSLCGNDTASEREMFRRYMIDSVYYWAEEYQIDGFRFDLMGLHDVETMNQIREALNQLPGGQDILVYGEPWSGDYSPMADGAIPATKENTHELDTGIAIFCDKTRDAIKGDVFISDEGGFVNGKDEEEMPGVEEDVKQSVCAWCERELSPKRKDVTPKQPSQIISYVSAHDNFTLWDKLFYTLPENQGKKRNEIDFTEKKSQILRQSKMAAAMYFTCLGTVFFQAGEEFGRTKQGIGDSYNAPPEVNALTWKQTKDFQQLVAYYQGLIAFRKEWKDLFGRDAVNVEVEFMENDTSGLIAFGIAKQNCEKELFVIYNRNEEKAILPLLEGNWKVICDGERVTCDYKDCAVAEGQILVKNEAVMILAK